MTRLQKIGVFFFAKLLAAVMAVAGMVAGILYSVGGLIVDTLVSMRWVSPEAAATPGLSYGTVLALGALVGMPFIFATVGFAAGMIAAPLYNVFARWFGGIEMDVGTD
ncbi:MAG: hypothetical protein SH819_04655 [Cytophagales bacterium]|nr:hypothetical protein [Cytophagales bacterium]